MRLLYQRPEGVLVDSSLGLDYPIYRGSVLGGLAAIHDLEDRQVALYVRVDGVGEALGQHGRLEIEAEYVGGETESLLTANAPFNSLGVISGSTWVRVHGDGALGTYGAYRETPPSDLETVTRFLTAVGNPSQRLAQLHYYWQDD